MASPYRVRHMCTDVLLGLVVFPMSFKAPSVLLDTTREKRQQESEGLDYHFLSVHVFEESILNNRYGTHQQSTIPPLYWRFIPSVLFQKVYRKWAIRWALLRDERGLSAQGDSSGQGVPPGRAPECK